MPKSTRPALRQTIRRSCNTAERKLNHAFRRQSTNPDEREIMIDPEVNAKQRL